MVNIVTRTKSVDGCCRARTQRPEIRRAHVWRWPILLYFSLVLIKIRMLSDYAEGYDDSRGTNLVVIVVLIVGGVGDRHTGGGMVVMEMMQI